MGIASGADLAPRVLHGVVPGHPGGPPTGPPQQIDRTPGPPGHRTASPVGAAPRRATGEPPRAAGAAAGGRPRAAHRGPPPAVPRGVPPTTAPPATTVEAEDKPAPRLRPKEHYNDGTFLGWGTSRHGDIQASVKIEDGRIVAASIAQCWTRYSCSWVAHLPPQVVARQSPEVDYVSGATQSANAFYWAVIDALNKSK